MKLLYHYIFHWLYVGEDFSRGMTLKNDLSGLLRDFVLMSETWLSQRRILLPHHIVCFTRLMQEQNPGDTLFGGWQFASQMWPTCFFKEWANGYRFFGDYSQYTPSLYSQKPPWCQGVCRQQLGDWCRLITLSVLPETLLPLMLRVEGVVVLYHPDVEDFLKHLPQGA